MIADHPFTPIANALLRSQLPLHPCQARQRSTWVVAARRHRRQTLSSSFRPSVQHCSFVPFAHCHLQDPLLHGSPVKRPSTHASDASPPLVHRITTPFNPLPPLLASEDSNCARKRNLLRPVSQHFARCACSPASAQFAPQPALASSRSSNTSHLPLSSRNA